MSDRDDMLRADLDAGLRFTHEMGEQTRHGVDEIALTVLALIEELMERGAIDSAELARRAAARQLKEIERIEDHHHVRIGTRDDKYTFGPLPDIDCEARMPLCRGRCCTLHFALSKQDLNERVVKWDYSRPYIIRQREDRYCVHNDPVTHFCSVYERRPAVCRAYDCRNDKRIWVDFEKRIPAIDPRLEPKDVPVPLGEPPR